MCKECEKRAMGKVAPLNVSYPCIKDEYVEEFCKLFRKEKDRIFIVHFEKEHLGVTIGLESEIKMFEEAMEKIHLPDRCEQYKAILKKLVE